MTEWAEHSEAQLQEAKRQTECARKRRYAPGGRRQLNRALRNFRRSGKDVVAYHCEWCGGIHLTNESRSKRLRAQTL